MIKPKFALFRVRQKIILADTMIFCELHFSKTPETFDPVDMVSAVVEIKNELETLLVSKLAPVEISDYVNSLKALAEHWYYSWFPYDSELETEEKTGLIN